MAKWISVNDELPSNEFTMLAIVIAQNEQNAPCWHFDLVHFTHRGNRKFFFKIGDGGREEEVCVTHWHRAPKLPSDIEITKVAKATYPELW